jgi:hypothetical protein
MSLSLNFKQKIYRNPRFLKRGFFLCSSNSFLIWFFVAFDAILQNRFLKKPFP